MAKYTLDSLPVELNKYKVITLDLDDTLLRSDKSISETNKRVLQKAQQQGFSIAIATGRHPKSAVRVMTELGCLNENSYAVCFNGSCVVRLSEYIAHNSIVGYPTVFRTTASGKLAKVVTAFAHSIKGARVHGYSVTRGLVIEDHNPYTQIEIDTSDVGFVEDDFMKISDHEEFFKVMIVGEEKVIDEVKSKLPESLTSVFNVVRSNPNFLEFIPNKSSKGTGLRSLCIRLGYPVERSIAFGDAENDLHMLETAGLGVAMENGFDVVKAAADVVTKTNDEDGVALVIEKFLK